MLETHIKSIENSWKKIFDEFFMTNSGLDILKNFDKEMAVAPESTHPAKEFIFHAFNLCPLQKTKVIILGQDPYHGEDQAIGLSFAVPNHTKIPPSLQNIFKEIENDLQVEVDKKNGDLSRWTNQGVLLLNSVLSVRGGLPGSHSHIGWEHFTDYIIKYLSDHTSGLVFLLWGNFAKKKKSLIDETKHLVLESAHPSPLSAHGKEGFFGNHHFSKANNYLKDIGASEIDWK